MFIVLLSSMITSTLLLVEWNQEVFITNAFKFFSSSPGVSTKSVLVLIHFTVFNHAVMRYVFSDRLKP